MPQSPEGGRPSRSEHQLTAELQRCLNLYAVGQDLLFDTVGTAAVSLEQVEADLVIAHIAACMAKAGQFASALAITDKEVISNPARRIEALCEIAKAQHQAKQEPAHVLELALNIAEQQANSGITQACSIEIMKAYAVIGDYQTVSRLLGQFNDPTLYPIIVQTALTAGAFVDAKKMMQMLHGGRTEISKLEAKLYVQIAAAELAAGLNQDAHQTITLVKDVFNTQDDFGIDYDLLIAAVTAQAMTGNFEQAEQSIQSCVSLFYRALGQKIIVEHLARAGRFVEANEQAEQTIGSDWAADTYIVLAQQAVVQLRDATDILIKAKQAVRSVPLPWNRAVQYLKLGLAEHVLVLDPNETFELAVGAAHDIPASVQANFLAELALAQAQCGMNPKTTLAHAKEAAALPVINSPYQHLPIEGLGRVAVVEAKLGKNPAKTFEQARILLENIKLYRNKGIQIIIQAQAEAGLFLSCSSRAALQKLVPNIAVLQNMMSTLSLDTRLIATAQQSAAFTYQPNSGKK